MCKTPGALNPQWKNRAQDEADRLRTEAAAWDGAERKLREAVREARELLVPAPSALQEVAGIIAAGPTLRTWEQWRAGITLTVPNELADHLEKNHEPLLDALENLKIEAQAELNARRERWRPVGATLPSGPRRRAAHASGWNMTHR